MSTMVVAQRVALAKLIFQNIPMANIGDVTGLRGSSAAGKLYIGLAVGNPGAGDQSTNEVAYPGYARVGLDRDSTKWSVDGSGSVANLVDVLFPERTDADAAVTAAYVTVGTAASGAGSLLFVAPLDSPASLSISQGVQPRIKAGSLTGTVS